MTVSAAYDPITTAGNDVTTAFSVTWPFFTGSLLVTLIDSDGVETVKTISTHYTVSGGTDANGLPATGTVTMLTAPATGEKLRIERVTPRTQATTYSNDDAFPAKTTESALDKLHLLMQEVLYETDRAIKLRTADREAGVDPVLPLWSRTRKARPSPSTSTATASIWWTRAVSDWTSAPLRRALPARMRRPPLPARLLTFCST
jgi:hypothetical protein